MKTPNQALQRTASQPAIHLVSVYHPPLLCVASHTGLVVADLMSSLGDMRATEPKEPQAMFDELRHLSVNRI